MDVFSVAAGGAGVGGAYFLLLSARKALPAVIAAAKAKWAGSKPDLAVLQEDIASAQDLIGSHAGAIEELRSQLAAALREFAKLKAQLPGPPAVPAFLTGAPDPAADKAVS